MTSILPKRVYKDDNCSTSCACSSLYRKHNDIYLIHFLPDIGLTLLCYTVQCSYSTQCYLCSWSQKEESLGVNHTAKCRDEFFRQDKVSATHCDFGCELHIFKDLNGIIESVRRTCGKEPKSRMDISSGCSASRMRQGTTKICRCQTDYCNSSRGTVIASLTLTFVGVVIAAMFFLWRC